MNLEDKAVTSMRGYPGLPLEVPVVGTGAYRARATTVGGYRGPGGGARGHCGCGPGHRDQLLDDSARTEGIAGEATPGRRSHSASGWGPEEDAQQRSDAAGRSGGVGG